MTDKNKEKSGKGIKAFENLAPLFGLAAQIGTAIPGLKKPKKSNAAADAARETSKRAAGAAVGASQTGFGASRGLALRSGLRAASDIAREGAVAAGRAADLDEQRHQKAVAVRNANLATFGKDLAETGASIGQGLVESRTAAEAEKAAGDAKIQELRTKAAGLLPTYGQTMGIDPATGLSTGQTEQAQPQTLEGYEEVPTGPGPDLDQMDPNGDPYDGEVLPEPPTLAELSLDPALAELGIGEKEALYSIAPELELQHRMENFAADEAYRTGGNLLRVYARVRRMQNSPAIGATIDMNRQLQLQMPRLGGQ